MERKLSCVNVHKAPGPNQLPNWLPRDFSNHLAGPVCAIYNASVLEGFVPSSWKESKSYWCQNVQLHKAVESDLRLRDNDILDALCTRWLTKYRNEITLQLCETEISSFIIF